MSIIKEYLIGFDRSLSQEVKQDHLNLSGDQVACLKNYS